MTSNKNISKPESARQYDLAQSIATATAALELQDPDDGAGPVDRWLNRIVEATGVLILATVFLLILGNALMRYLVNGAILWSEEVAIAALPWVAMLGLLLAVRRRQMIALDFLVDLLPSSYQAALVRFSFALCTVIFCTLAYTAYHYTAIFGRDPSPYLGFSKGLSTSAFTIGAGLIALAFFAALVRTMLGKKNKGMVN